MPDRPPRAEPGAEPPARPAPAAAGAGSDLRFPCTKCGADLRFAPGQTQLVCDYCGTTVQIEGASRDLPPIRELDLRSALDKAPDAAETTEARVSRCPNCGAQVEFDPRVHAAECPFCATPVVAEPTTVTHLRPRGLVPFALTEAQARAAMTDWLGRLWFAPGGLLDYARKGRRLQGIYVPYWTFDADTRSSYRGQRGTIYYETQTVQVRGQDGRSRMETRRVQRIRWQPVSGQVARFFDDVLVLASSSLPVTYTDGLAPWNLAALEPYRAEYLAGFRAETYGVALDQGFVTARAVMDQTIARDVKFDIGGDAQQVGAIDTTLGKVTYKHILLPVWMAAYRYRGRTFRFVVNGQTGRVQGERPWSAVKIALAIAALAILVAAVVLASQYADSGQLRLNLDF